MANTIYSQSVNISTNLIKYLDWDGSASAPVPIKFEYKLLGPVAYWLEKGTITSFPVAVVVPLEWPRFSSRSLHQQELQWIAEIAVMAKANEDENPWEEARLLMTAAAENVLSSGRIGMKDVIGDIEVGSILPPEPDYWEAIVARDKTLGVSQMSITLYSMCYINRA